MTMTTTNGKNANTEPMNIDNINMTETEIDNNDDFAKSDNNDDNPIMSDKESPLESPAKDNVENDVKKVRTVQKKYLHL